MVTAFKKAKSARKASKLDSSTLRGFGGGWNSIDEDLSMKPSFQVSLINFHRTTSGAQAVRYGQQFITDVKDLHNADIVDGIYYNAWNVLFLSDGYVVKVNEDGSAKTVIWAGFPAGTVVDGPIFTQVSFVLFKDTLIIHTGKTKPLVVKPDLTCNYLGDPVGGNANTPVGHYGCIVSNYHCIANMVVTELVPPTTGVLTVTKRLPTTIYISSKGTSGVFPGDPPLNDSISLDVGAYAPEGAASIRGIAGFRTYLLVFLQNITLQVKLGEYDDSEPPKHIPKFPDTLPQFGILGNRCITTVENDIMFCGLSGLASAKRNLYSPDSITSDFLSTAISTKYRQIVGALTDEEQLVKSFATYDKLNNDFLLFMPAGRVLCYTFNSRLKMHAWSEFESMDWTAAWSSILGRVFLAKGTKLFLGGNSTFEGENFYADRVEDRDYNYAPARPSLVQGDLVYDTVTLETWECLVTHPGTAVVTFEQERENHPEKWVLYEGRPIVIEMELPWIDGKDPLKLKQLRYVSIATKGDAEFTFDAYVDNLYKDVEGNIVHMPGVSMAFIGNDAYGYGFDDGPYGMGRRSRDPRLFGVPIKFKSIKFKIWGSTTKKLEIVNLSFLYARNKLSGFVR